MRGTFWDISCPFLAHASALRGAKVPRQVRQISQVIKFRGKSEENNDVRRKKREMSLQMSQSPARRTWRSVNCWTDLEVRPTDEIDGPGGPSY